MKTGFDISRISGDGYLIIPLSMAKLAEGHGQSPEDVYEIAQYFPKKLDTLSNDVILLYSIGTYFNTESAAFEKRIKLNQQARQHSTKLRKLISDNKEFIPGAFHYLPVDYVILNSSYFFDYFSKLQKLEQVDKAFRDEIKKDIGEREYTEASVNFILEEVVVSHILRQRLVRLPRTLVQNDIWRLLVYPGPGIHADKYQFQKSMFPQKDAINPYNDGQYNFLSKKYESYSNTHNS